MIPTQLDAPEIAQSPTGSDSWMEATLRLEEAARLLDVEDWILERLRHAEREITVNLPLRDGTGQALSCTGFRVQHHSSRGPCMGEVRLEPEANLNQIRARAAAATWQWAALDLPLGGSSGALLCDARQLSEGKLRRLLQEYVHGLRGAIGPSTDVLAVSGGNDYIAGWLLESYSQMSGRTDPAAVAGKPEALGGMAWRSQAPGWAITRLLEEALATRKQALTGARVAIQGLGKLGSSALDALHGAGARIVAVADSSGGLYRDYGIDVPALQQHLRRAPMVYGFPEAEAVSNAEVVATACDVLLAATPKHQIDARIAPHVQAPIVVEAAEEAIVPEAECLLLSRDVLVIPGLLGTAGSAVAQFLEWSQAVRGTWTEEQEAMQVVRGRVAQAYHSAAERANALKCTFSIAVYISAVDRVSSSLRFLVRGA